MQSHRPPPLHLGYTFLLFLDPAYAVGDRAVNLFKRAHSFPQHQSENPLHLPGKRLQDGLWYSVRYLTEVRRPAIAMRTAREATENTIRLAELHITEQEIRIERQQQLIAALESKGCARDGPDGSAAAGGHDGLAGANGR